MFISISLTSFSQNYSYFLNRSDYVSIENQNFINFKSETTKKIKIDFPITYNGKQFQEIYVSQEGWISFEENTNPTEIFETGNSSSFITPLYFLDESSKENYSVSYDIIKKSNNKHLIIQWENENLSFQCLLYENGNIEFKYNNKIEFLKEKLASTDKYTFGIMNSQIAVGNFAFDDKYKKKSTIKHDFLYKNASIVFSKSNHVQKTTPISEKKIDNPKGLPKTTTNFVSPGAHTWTCPAGVNSITVYCYGGGGAGGGSSWSSGGGAKAGAGGGGGGGSFASSTVTVTPSVTYDIVVGAGGTGAANTDGTNGGNSTFDNTTVVAYGGSGGLRGSTGGEGAGGAGGILGTGTTRYVGGNGNNGKKSSYGGGGGGGAGTTAAGGNASNQTGGAGGTLNGGNGGNGSTTDGGNGSLGATYGGAGAGSLGNAAGGSGANGAVIIEYTAPMSYVSSITTQNNTTDVNSGTTDAEIIGIEIVTSGTANPLDITSFTLNANGTTDIGDLTGIATIYYTGTSSTFATTTIFGTNTATIADYTITGTQELAEGTNYFWLVYDIDAAATLGNYVDAECTELELNSSITENPGTTAPSGRRQIAVDYCDITNGLSTSSYYIEDFSTTGGTTNITNNNSGFSNDGYGDFTAMEVTAMPSAAVNFTIQGSGTSTFGFAIWVDWNNDGDFNDTDEDVFVNGDYDNSVTGSFTVPAGATAGNKRMRVVSDWMEYYPSACGGDSYTEAEDYTFVVGSLISCSGTPIAGTISSDISDFCGTGTPTLTASGYTTGVTGITLQWQSSPDGSSWSDIVGATSDTYTANPAITETTYYQLVVTCTNSGNSDVSNTETVTNTSDIIQTITSSPVSIACGNTATLTATSRDGNDIYWWTTETGGSSVANTTSGANYTTPVISSDATYYASTGDGGTSANVGKETSDLSDGYYTSTGAGLVFDALADMTIVSVNVYVETAGTNIDIQLKNSSGTVLETASFSSVGAGLQTLTLNMDVPAGTDYKLIKSNLASLARDYDSDPTTSFPYTLAGVCSITDGTLSGYYYFFYDWVVSTGCESARVPVEITVSGETAPDCANLTAPVDGTTGINPSDVELTWDASLTDCQHATSYLLYLGTDNPPTNIINGTDIGNVTSYTPSGLTAPETYYWKIVPINDAGAASGCSVFDFITDYTYCEPSFTDLDDEWITNVTFNTIDNTTVAEGGPSSYGDYTAQSTTVTLGTTYEISVTFESTWSQDIAVWFDWNHDGDFIDAGEEYILADDITSPLTVTLDITVPLTATIGSTRMRVMTTETDPPSPCLSASYGETEDYTIDIASPGTSTITTGGGTEATSIPTTITAQGAAILNFDFDINDDGNTEATDNDPTLISQITITQGTGNDILDWSDVIAGAELSDGSNTILASSITTNSIIFSGITYGGSQLGEILDNQTKNYKLKVWLQCPSFEINEGDNFVFEVKSTTITLATGSSGFNPNENENSGETNNAYDVTATQMVFLEQPSETEVNAYMFPTVEIAMVDACGNIDTDVIGTVSLTSTGTNATMSPAIINSDFRDGVATFEILHTGIEESELKLNASYSIYDIQSNLFDIIIKNCSITTNPAHNNGILEVCTDQEIDFTGVYTGGGTANSWRWTMGDGSDVLTQNVSDYSYSGASGYYIELTVDDGSTCATAVRVLVSGGPVINNISPDIETCQGGTYDLSASGTEGSPIQVSGFSGTGAVALSLADETFLPDGVGVAYTSELEYTQFDPTSTLTDANLVTVYANIEHSYYGDIIIHLECPNGSKVRLAGEDVFEYESINFGEPIDFDTDLNPGVGYEYRWTEVSPTYPSMNEMVATNSYLYHDYTDIAIPTANNYTDVPYFPAGTYAPYESFSGLIGCPLNGTWIIHVEDRHIVDNGYIFEWGLELDESLMPGTWEYETEILSYLWTGTGLAGGYTGGPDVTATPPSLGTNTYNLEMTDDYGCTSSQDVDVNVIVCDGTWTGDVDTDWDDKDNWTNKEVPTCSGGTTIIPTTPNGGVFPVITTSAEAYDLEIQSDASVTIAPTGSLTVCGTLTDVEGVDNDLVIQSDATGTGSLIHNTAGVDGTIYKYIPGTRYHYIGSPVSGATDASIGVSTTQFYAWNPEMEWQGVDLNNDGTTTLYDDDYAPWGTTYTGSLNTGVGYAYYHETQTLQFAGDINVGDYNLTLKKHSTSDMNQGWNLISNPYAATLSWDNIVGTAWNSNIEGAVYLFDDDGTGFQSNYRYYVPAAEPTGGTYSVGTSNATQYIPVAQGFFVRTTADEQTLTLEADDRVHSTQAFYKNDDVHPNFFKLKINGNTYSDELIVRLLEDATFGFDGMLDARKLIPSNPNIPQLYSISDAGDNMSITSIPMYTDNATIKLTVVALPGIFTITSDDFHLDYGRKVYLHDINENKYEEITQNFNYEFAFEGGITSSRFELVFTVNHAPYLNEPIEDITTLEDETFYFAMNEQTFIDQDNEELDYSITLSNGADLPDWLTFNNETLSFEGLPQNSDVGNYNIRIEVSDSYGESVIDEFVITVLNTNDAPYQNFLLNDISIEEGMDFSFYIDEQTFLDIDINDVLSYSANYFGGLLPSWLIFDAEELRFYGSTYNVEPEDYQITLVATDIAGAFIQDNFLLEVTSTANSISEDNQSITISPNPNNGFFQISTNEATSLEYGISIYDELGRLVLKTEAYANIVDIDISDFASGVYNVKVEFNNKTIIKKVVIQ